MNKHLHFARRFANLMDNRFHIFGIGFGLDTIIGLIPGLGDLVTLGMSAYLVWIGYDMRLPTHRLLEMVKNVLLDFLIGSIPLVGGVVDLFYKANLKNLEILEEFEGVEIIEGEVVKE